MSTQYNPFEDLERLFDRMSRQFSDASRGWDTGEGLERWWTGTNPLQMDMIDRGEDLVVTVDLPGYERDDVEVYVSNQTLHIEVEHEEREEMEDHRIIRQERRHRSLSRSMSLPTSVDDEAVSARMKNGVLTITLPKVTVEHGREIEITVD